MAFASREEQTIESLPERLANDEVMERVAEEIVKPDARTRRPLFFALRSRFINHEAEKPFEMRLLEERPRFENYLYLLLQIYNDYSFIELAKEIMIYFRHDTMAGVFYKRVAEIFDQVTLDTNEDLRDYVKEEHLEGIGIDQILDVLEEETLRFMPEMDRPDYLIEQPADLDVDHLPHLEEPLETLDSSPEAIFNYLLGVMQDERLRGYDLQISAIRKKVNEMSEREREDFALAANVDVEALISLRRNQTLCSIFGPVNPMISDDFTNLTDDNGNPDENKIYGGPRMFLDMQYEADTFLETSYTDWFTPNCQQCRLKIPNRYWAVRIPAFGGGWSGCYHSWDCVRLSIKGVLAGEEEPAELELDEKKEEDKKRLVQLTLVDAYEDFLNECGVYEREDEEAPERDFDI